MSNYHDISGNIDNLKWSHYNLVIENDAVYLVYNTVSGRILSVNKRLLHSDPSGLDGNMRSALKRDGFLVDSDTDEFKQLLQKSKEVSEYPDNEDIDITIAPSLRCNMKCDYCFEKNPFTRKLSGDMTPEVQAATLDYILKLAGRKSTKRLKITWFGGEPLLMFDTVRDFTSNLKSRLSPSVELISRIITNGLLLTKPKLTELVRDCNLRFAQIAIDGSKSRYTAVRNVDAPCYDRVIENIINCCELIPTRIRLNATPDNIEELYRMAETFLSRIDNLSNVSFTLSEVTNYTDNSASVCFFKPGAFRNEWRRFQEFLFKKGLVDGYNYTEKYYPIGCKYFLKDTVAIDPLGFLYKCEHHFGDDRFIIGDVFAGLKRGDRPLHIYTESLIDMRCHSCKVYPICKYASCSDYRRFMGSDRQLCLCRQGQIDSISKDILDHLSILPVSRLG
ncbi:MAG: radical SAM protein [Bacteroidales bacterium]|nr:radical SAM protein [Bacteroidales bacterium]